MFSVATEERSASKALLAELRTMARPKLKSARGWTVVAWITILFGLFFFALFFVGGS